MWVQSAFLFRTAVDGMHLGRLALPSRIAGELEEPPLVFRILPHGLRLFEGAAAR
jgi:hypothetical protein